MLLLDFTGGSLAIFQMVLQAFNCDDWSVFRGNAVKIGIGLVSILFDMIFMFQHYVLYSQPKKNGEYDQVAEKPIAMLPPK